MSYLTSKSSRVVCTVAVGLWVAACGTSDEGGPLESPHDEESEDFGQILDAATGRDGSARDQAPRGTADAGRAGADAGRAGADAGRAEADASTPAPATGEGCLAASSDSFQSAGPYGVKTKEVTVGELGAYTVFYPQRFEAGCAHPIVAWGNGTGVTGSATYQHWHRHAASWGLVVIAAHNSNAGSQRFLEGGIDYLLKENQTASSEFAGKLSTRAGVAGHSQGGFAATTATRHPNVKAEVNVQGGGTPAPTAAHLCLTGTEDFVRQSCTASHNAARGPSFLSDLEGADHISTPTTGGARTPLGRTYVRLYTAWFRCHLGDDAAACNLFEGGKSAPVCGWAAHATCDGRNIP